MPSAPIERIYFAWNDAQTPLKLYAHDVHFESPLPPSAGK